MTLYLFRCPTHGEIEINRPMAEAGEPAICPSCLADRSRAIKARDGYAGLGWQDALALMFEGIPPMTRVYTPPVTDCRSFGRNQYIARTPEHLRRARSDDQERSFRDAARETGARVQFGAGKSTGS